MAGGDEHGARRDEGERRPTEAEAWAEFWDRLAVIWLDLPPETQPRIAEFNAPIEANGLARHDRSAPHSETS